MTKLTAQEIEAIRNRLDGVKGTGWLPSDGIYVIDSDEVVVAECDSEVTAQFLGNAQWDITRLLAEVKQLREIVVAIGLNESVYTPKELDEGYFAENDKLIEMCKEYATMVMSEHKVGICDVCYGIFNKGESMLEDTCAECFDKYEMMTHGWLSE